MQIQFLPTFWAIKSTLEFIFYKKASFWILPDIDEPKGSPTERNATSIWALCSEN